MKKLILIGLGLVALAGGMCAWLNYAADARDRHFATRDQQRFNAALAHERQRVGKTNLTANQR